METVLYSFANTPDGANPVNGLIFDPAGNLYGKTFYGGGGDGIVFELSPSGAGWTEQAIYVPTTQASNSGLTMDAAGNIFGTTYSTVFELSPNGKGGWKPNVIHTFCRGKDGCNAEGTLALDQAGNLYGTTVNGGHYGTGTVYKLSPGEKGWTEKRIHVFTASVVLWPFAGPVLDAAGNIYGTAEAGWPGGGAIYELSPTVGTGEYREHLLWRFNGYDGSCYFGNVLLDSGGILYGTTPNGGSTFDAPPGFGAGYGTVFEVNPSIAVTTTTLTSSPNPSTYGQAVTFAAVVTSSAGAPPDGETVSFMKNRTVLGTGALSGGLVSFTTSALGLGTNSVRAMYGGDWNFLGSKSKWVKQVVTDGTHKGPYGVVSPSALNFGQVVVGQTSLPQSVSLTNIGDSELIVSNISISADFAITVNHCANGVKPATHCNVDVTFTPQSPGVETGTLTFADNASNSPQSVSLTGTGTTAALK
jgi:uncharacterized repeat protein (TIGR03803 family)